MKRIFLREDGNETFGAGQHSSPIMAAELQMATAATGIDHLPRTPCSTSAPTRFLASSSSLSKFYASNSPHMSKALSGVAWQQYLQGFDPIVGRDNVGARQATASPPPAFSQYRTKSKASEDFSSPLEANKTVLRASQSLDSFSLPRGREPQWQIRPGPRGQMGSLKRMNSGLEPPSPAPSHVGLGGSMCGSLPQLAGISREPSYATLPSAVETWPELGALRVKSYATRDELVPLKTTASRMLPELQTNGRSLSRNPSFSGVGVNAVMHPEDRLEAPEKPRLAGRRGNAGPFTSEMEQQVHRQSICPAHGLSWVPK